MLMFDILDKVREITNHYEQNQLDNINDASALICESLINGGMIYCYDIGHSNESDFINRAGGLAAIKKFSFNFNVSSDIPRSRIIESNPDIDLEFVRFAVSASNLQAGDIMLMGSVSGKNRIPIELAIVCREIGVKVIGFTSLEYTASLESNHPTGKKLCDVCDVVIDNGAPYGDACIDSYNYEYKIIPISGISMTIGGWLILGNAIEMMTKQGFVPTIFKSINSADGAIFYEECIKQFNERGY